MENVRVLSLRNGSWSRHDTDSFEEVQDLIEADPLTWVHAAGSSAEPLKSLEKAFGLHPLTIEDIQNERQRPKAEDYPDLTFVVLRVPRYEEDELRWHQVGLLLGRDFLLSASVDHTKELDAVQERLLQKGLPAGRHGVDSLFHLVLDALVDAWFPFMDDLEDRLESIEDAVMDRADRPGLARIRDLKEVVSRTRKVLMPMREATQNLERNDHPHIGKDAQIYLRDVADHTIRLSERLDHVKEMALLAQETWNATLANNQNEQMRRLTVLFALFLIPTFIAGLGGMNFPGIPEWDYWIVTGALMAFVVTGSAFAVVRRWL